MKLLNFGFRLSCLKQCNGLIAFYSAHRKLILQNLTNGVKIHVHTVQKYSHSEYFQFGFDSSSKKYKVLVWVEDETTDYRISNVHISSLGKGSSWRPIKEISPLRNLAANQHALVNGTVFWFDVDEGRIISFNFAEETFQITKISGEINLKTFVHSVLDFDGFLALVEMHVTDDEQRAEIKENLRGRFVKLLISPRMKGSRSACLCFSAGSNYDGWALLGSKIRSLLAPVRNVTNSQPPAPIFEGKVRNNVSFEGVCAFSSPFFANPQISVQSRGAVRGASWCQPVVLCRFDGTAPDWFWV
ncbi:hypothetical protein FRX31_030593 [Thalictrum thalictroides]|uniref:F-box associated beta-propeller type 3 domain-containing protein n=1 Tax=Thalictrum thalictroides TaxID=46969 RepID=A0A7J6V435_THATH|nr:hypothetical protein FRX31_030593 [Thalictrum thalictroides]